MELSPTQISARNLEQQTRLEHELRVLFEEVLVVDHHRVAHVAPSDPGTLVQHWVTHSTGIIPQTLCYEHHLPNPILRMGEGVVA